MNIDKVENYANLPRKQKKKAKKLIESHRWMFFQWCNELHKKGYYKQNKVIKITI